MNTKWSVYSGKASDVFEPFRVWHEDGYIYDYPKGYVCLLVEGYGYEYIHPYRFPQELVERFVQRVQAHFDTGGEPNLEHWGSPRVIYGTQAYLDEEPAMVAREKSDAPFNERWR